MQQIEEARQLLPWYITGKLSSPEAKLVKEALKASPILYSEYEMQCKLSQMIKKDPKLMEISAIRTQEQRMGALMQRIRAEEPRVAATAPPTTKIPSVWRQKFADIKQYIKTRSRFSTKQWAFAAIASIVFIQVAWFSSFMQQESGHSANDDYELVTEKPFESNSSVAPAFEPPLATEVKSIIIVFFPTATTEEKQQVLQTIDGNITKRSSDGISYTLRFSQPMSEEKANRLTDSLQKHRLVKFVGWGPD